MTPDPPGTRRPLGCAYARRARAEIRDLCLTGDELAGVLRGLCPTQAIRPRLGEDPDEYERHAAGEVMIRYVTA